MSGTSRSGNGAARAMRALAPEVLERMERIARGFPGRTVTVEGASRGFAAGVTVRIDGVDAEELFDVYFAQTA
jgi:hypothetical protein